jgi:hypothetical protein
MQVPLTAYAQDCSFTGELTLTGDRLSDFLASTVEFEVLNLRCRALDDGRVVEALYTTMLRDDLCLVLAGEPRGREDLRIWTRQFPVIARVGPYTVRGYIHAPPTIDPLRLPSRRAIVPVTSGTVTFAEAGTEVAFQAETVLVNSTWIEALEASTAEDLGEADVEDQAFPELEPLDAGELESGFEGSGA